MTLFHQFCFFLFANFQERFNEIFNENIQLKQALTYTNQKLMNPAAMFYASPPIRKSAESVSFDDSTGYAANSTTQLNVTSNTIETAVNDKLNISAANTYLFSFFDYFLVNFYNRYF
jgi:hypothetical protein